jgi:hypothetical protein
MMSDGIQAETIRLAQLILGMPEENAVRTLAGMELFLRARVLRTIEADCGKPEKAEVYRLKMVTYLGAKGGAN